MDGLKLVQLLRETEGFRARRYSGRAMYGRECVGVDLNHAGDLFRVGVELGRLAYEQGRAEDDVLGDLRSPRTDSMGMGMIAYWPDVEWPAGEPEDEDPECSMCGGELDDATCTECGFAME